MISNETRTFRGNIFLFSVERTMKVNGMSCVFGLNLLEMNLLYGKDVVCYKKCLNSHFHYYIKTFIFWLYHRLHEIENVIKAHTHIYAISMNCKLFE